MVPGGSPLSSCGESLGVEKAPGELKVRRFHPTHRVEFWGVLNYGARAREGPAGSTLARRLKTPFPPPPIHPPDLTRFG